MRKLKLPASRALPLLAALATLLLSACGTSAPLALVPTLDIDSASTQAAQTLISGIATEQSGVLTTATAASTPMPSLLVTATAGLPVTGAVTAAVPVTGGTAVTTGGTQQCDSSAYVSDVTIPDGTILAPGAPFTKTWAVSNTGTCTWTTGYRLAFLGGEAMGGTAVSLGGEVAPGQQTQISVDLVAPTGLGNYVGSWRFQNEQGQFFGDIITVVITVAPGEGTGTPGK